LKQSIEISKTSLSLKGEVQLPASKSISNRVLMIQAVSDKHFDIRNQSDSEDTVLLAKILTRIKKHKLSDIPLKINCKNAGTVARFILTYLAIVKKGNYLISGSARFKERPVGDLVTALNTMGANISYTENDGCFPLYVKPPEDIKNTVYINSMQSSQFLSSLLLIAPSLKNGLIIKTSDVIASAPYVEMTINIMSYFGVEVEKNNNIFVISPQHYIPQIISIEADWSAAAFWYQMVAYSQKAYIKLNALQKNSIQGDSVLAELYFKMGVNTDFCEDGVILSKLADKTDFFKFDFLNTPDIFPSVLLSCALLSVPAHLSGLHNLKIKESDRLTAVLTELMKFGINVFYDKCKCGLMLPKNNFCITSSKLLINTYKDHRIAMAFAAVAATRQSVVIHDFKVVSKSYPDFWTHLKNAGFIIKYT